jgi:hypothetical protein
MPSIQMQNRFLKKPPLMSTLLFRQKNITKQKLILAKNYFTIRPFQIWKTQLCHMSHSELAFTDGEKQTNL